MNRGRKLLLPLMLVWVSISIIMCAQKEETPGPPSDMVKAQPPAPAAKPTEPVFSDKPALISKGAEPPKIESPAEPPPKPGLPSPTVKLPATSKPTILPRSSTAVAKPGIKPAPKPMATPGKVSPGMVATAPKGDTPGMPVKAKPPVTVDIRAFTWPPPNASTKAKVERNLLAVSGAPTTLGQVADRLERAFDQAGYREIGWYSVPKGFALASRLEQTNPDGTCKPEEERWKAKACTPPIHSLGEYIRALFIPQKGHFRLIVFVVTSVPFDQTAPAPSREDAIEWVDIGVSALPAAIKKQRFTEEHQCTALIYEFLQIGTDSPAKFVDDASISCREHLKRARLLAALGGLP